MESQVRTVSGGRVADVKIWVFPKIGGKLPKWMVRIMENPIKMDDLGVPLFLETPKYLWNLWLQYFHYC